MSFAILDVDANGVPTITATKRTDKRGRWVVTDHVNGFCLGFVSYETVRISALSFGSAPTGGV